LHWTDTMQVMAASGVFNVITIVISVVSLSVSGTLALRQMRAAKDGYALPVVLDVFSTFRTESYTDAERYVLHQLGSDFPDPIPYSELPMSARSQLWRVAGLYDDLASLVAHGVVSESLVVGSRGNTVVRVWKVLRPFVEKDRQQRGSNAFVYLEDLAARASRTPPAEVHKRLHLLRYRERVQ
jgi:hypothetical protein